jgi:hypothetical protein
MNTPPDDAGRRLRNGLNRGTAPELSTDLVSGAADHPAPHLTHPRRRLQIAGGATAAVAAVALIAVVIAPGTSQAPLFTAAASTTIGDAASAGVPASESMRIAAEYRYHAGAGLGAGSGDGHVYQLTRTGSGSDRAAALAAIFGLSATPTTETPTDPAYPTWTVGSVDGTTPTLQVVWSGAGDWWYSEAMAVSSPGCDPSVSGSDGSTSASGETGPGVDPAAPDCSVDSAPSGPSAAPTGADARALAQKLFAATGLEVSTNDIQVSSDDWQTTATAVLVVDGEKTALDWGVSWSSTGEISSAWGHSVSIVDRGLYGTVSAADAVARLSDGRWYGAAGPDYQGGVVAYATERGTSDAGATTSAPSTGSDGDTATEAPPVEQEPTTTPVVDVTIDTARSTLLLMWDSEGDAWLVPGFALQGDEGWWSTVVSLVPGVIELPAVSTVEPDLIAPAVGTPEGVETAPADK